MVLDVGVIQRGLLETSFFVPLIYCLSPACRQTGGRQGRQRFIQRRLLQNKLFCVLIITEQSRQKQGEV